MGWDTMEWSQVGKDDSGNNSSLREVLVPQYDSWNECAISRVSVQNPRAAQLHIHLHRQRSSRVTESTTCLSITRRNCNQEDRIRKPACILPKMSRIRAPPFLLFPLCLFYFLTQFFKALFLIT